MPLENVTGGLHEGLGFLRRPGVNVAQEPLKREGAARSATPARFGA